MLPNTTGTSRIRTAGCPACRHKLAFVIQGYTSIYRCAKCEALYGSCYLGNSYHLVLPWMTRPDPPGDRLRYLDLECLGTKGLKRRHGWYDLQTKRIVQVG